MAFYRRLAGQASLAGLQTFHLYLLAQPPCGREPALLPPIDLIHVGQMWPVSINLAVVALWVPKKNIHSTRIVQIKSPQKCWQVHMADQKAGSMKNVTPKPSLKLAQRHGYKVLTGLVSGKMVTGKQCQTCFSNCFSLGEEEEFNCQSECHLICG